MWYKGTSTALWCVGCAMNQPLDIFRREPTGRFIWLGTAGSLLEANSKIRSLGDGTAEYLVVNEESGERIVVKPPDSPSKASAA